MAGLVALTFGLDLPHVREDMLERARYHAGQLGGAFHGESLAAPRLTIREHRTVIPRGGVCGRDCRVVARVAIARGVC